jgi:dipeptidyl aminopeptidase/acylaminoacyl peptidase
MCTRTYLILWSALLVGVVLVVILVGCSGGFTEGEIQEKVEEAVGTTMSDLSFAPTPVPPTDRIAFTSDRDGNDEIYVMDADGSNQTNLTSNSADDEAPSWSPDGSKIAFISDPRETSVTWAHVVLDRNTTKETYDINYAKNSGSIPLSKFNIGNGDLGWNKLTVSVNRGQALVYLNNEKLASLSIQPVQPDRQYVNAWTAGIMADDEVGGVVSLRRPTVAYRE